MRRLETTVGKHSLLAEITQRHGAAARANNRSLPASKEAVKTDEEVCDQLPREQENDLYNQKPISEINIDINNRSVVLLPYEQTMKLSFSRKSGDGCLQRVGSVRGRGEYYTGPRRSFIRRPGSLRRRTTDCDTPQTDDECERVSKSHVSRVLFPISTRKKLKNRSSAEGGQSYIKQRELVNESTPRKKGDVDINENCQDINDTDKTTVKAIANSNNLNQSDPQNKCPEKICGSESDGGKQPNDVSKRKNSHGESEIVRQLQFNNNNTDCQNVLTNLEDKHDDYATVNVNSCDAIEHKPNICINEVSELRQTASLENVKDDVSPDNNTSSDIIDNMDEINELLMDVLEEIEVKRITVPQCVHCLYTEGIINEHTAKRIMPSYDNSTKNNFAVGTPVKNAKESDDFLKNLLSVLSGLGLQTLTTCHRCILKTAGDNYKLMIMNSTPKHNVSVRRRYKLKTKICPPTNVISTSNETNNNELSNPPQENQSLIVKATVITNNEPTSCQAASKSELCLNNVGSHEILTSMLESDPFTINVRDSTPEFKHSKHMTSTGQINHSFSKPLRLQRLHSNSHAMFLSKVDIDIRRTLSLLVDQRILEVKQMWFIMNMADEAEQALNLKQCLYKLSKAELNCLYRVRGLEWLEDLMNDPSVITHPLGPFSPLPRKGFALKSIGSEASTSTSSSLKSTPTSPSEKSFCTVPPISESTDTADCKETNQMQRKDQSPSPIICNRMKFLDTNTEIKKG